jgi:hypothetical protein
MPKRRIVPVLADPSAPLEGQPADAPEAPSVPEPVPTTLERVSDPWGLTPAAVEPDELADLRNEAAELRLRNNLAQERLRAYSTPLESAVGDAVRVILSALAFRFGFAVVRECALETFDRWEAEGHG